MAGREIDASVIVDDWLRVRTGERPLLLFVNLFDTHVAYTVREEKRFVPEWASAREIRSRPHRPDRLLCGGLPSAQQIEVLRGLYLGDVSAADAKLDRILRRLYASGYGENLITIVTSDHGEHFGELVPAAPAPRDCSCQAASVIGRWMRRHLAH